MMSIERLSAPDLDVRPRYDSPRGGKDKGRFAVERDKAEAPDEAEGSSPLHDKGDAAKRRPPIRAGRKAGEAHDVHGHEHARRAREISEIELDWEDHEGQNDETAEDAEEGEGDKSGEAAADFEVLTSQLLHLGPIREVTLNLPALGVVTARRHGGSVDLAIQVSRGLLEAVRSGLGQMRAQLEAAGLTVGTVEISERPDSAPQDGPGPDRRWPELRVSDQGESLVDIMV